MFDFSQLGGLITSLAIWFAIMPTLVVIAIAATLMVFVWRFVKAQERMASALEIVAARYNREPDKAE
ncbi:hypothetical protein ACFLT7_06795 [candidate division KSB1 bacterium]